MIEIPYPHFEVDQCKFPMWVGGAGYMPLTDLAALIWLCHKTSGDIVELGCNLGMTTSHLAMAFPDKRIIAIDLPNASMHAGQLGESLYSTRQVAKLAVKYSNVYALALDSQTFNFWNLSPHATLVLVDADHTYDAVKRDTENAMRFLKGQEGDRYIVWHDYYSDNAVEWVGVYKYLQEWKNPEPQNIKDTSLAFLEVE